MIRKALAADLARLEHSIPKDILKGDPDFINTLVEAKEKANPFNPVVEELALNWLAHYSEDLPNEYGDKIRKKLKCEDSDAAIKGRVYRMGFRVAEQYQKPKSKP